jgi:hypothetical protein
MDGVQADLIGRRHLCVTGWLKRSAATKVMERIWIDIFSAKRIMGVFSGCSPQHSKDSCDRRVAMKISLCFTCAICLSCASVAQSAASRTPAASTALQTAHPVVQEQATRTDFTSKKGFVLEDGTPVRLRLNRTISSADAHVGDTVDLRTKPGTDGTFPISPPNVGKEAIPDPEIVRKFCHESSPFCYFSGNGPLRSRRRG